MKPLVLIACVVLLQSCFLYGPSNTKRLARLSKKQPIDVAIIPGLPLYEGKWDTLLKARMLWSEFLVKKGYVSNVLYSGNAVYTPWVESTTMALYAKALGIDSCRIMTDTLAEHSTENLYYGYLLAKQKGYKTVAIATDPVQCALIHMLARKYFPGEIQFIPLIYDSIKGRTGFECIIDTTLTKRSNFISLPKKQNYLKRFNGSRGKNIKRREEVMMQDVGDAQASN